MKRAALLLGSLLLAVPASGKAPMPWPSGTYGNVFVHEDTGDMLGVEARFFEDHGRPMVEFVQCEGWCNDVYVLPVARGDDGFTFHVRERTHSGGVGTEAGPEYRFVVRPSGARLKLSVWLGRDNVDADGKPQTLRRLGKPYAIPFAKANGAR